MRFLGDQSELARRTQPPENEIPVSAGVGALIARTPDVAIALVGVLVFSRGVQLEVAIRTRDDVGDAAGAADAAPAPWDLHELVDGRRGGHAQAQRLLLGVQFADGRTASTLGNPWQLAADGGEVPPPGPPPPLLLLSHSTSSERAYDATFWLTELPPAGDLVLVCAWPAFGIPETLVRLDAGELIAAAARVVVLWEPQPERTAGVRPTTPPDLPDGGWFRRALG